MLPLREILKNNKPKPVLNKSSLYNLSRIALFTNARDEKNIKEWAAHHLLLGFDSIFIFDHKSKEPLKQVFENFDKRVTIIDGSKLEGSVKMPFMNWALDIARRLKINKFIYLDADEFLVLHSPFSQVRDFLSKYNVPSLAINWLMFGSNHHEKDPTNATNLLIDSYTKSDASLNVHVKTFVSTAAAWKASNPHFYDLYTEYNHLHFSLDGHMLPPFYHHKCNKSFTDVPAYIAHYINQSEETFKTRKLDLPMDDTGKKRVIANYDSKKFHNEHNAVENLELLSTYSKPILNFLDQFNFQDKEQG
jgi:hypothetical protein